MTCRIVGTPQDPVPPGPAATGPYRDIRANTEQTCRSSAPKSAATVRRPRRFCRGGSRRLWCCRRQECISPLFAQGVDQHQAQAVFSVLARVRRFRRQRGWRPKPVTGAWRRGFPRNWGWGSCATPRALPPAVSARPSRRCEGGAGAGSIGPNSRSVNGLRTGEDDRTDACARRNRPTVRSRASQGGRANEAGSLYRSGVAATWRPMAWSAGVWRLRGIPRTGRPRSRWSSRPGKPSMTSGAVWRTGRCWTCRRSGRAARTST